AIASAAVRPRRSVLFVPASNPRAMDRARHLPADALIFDLEDAVAPEAKARARAAVVATVRAGGHRPREIIVRVNGPGTPWGPADLVEIGAAGADAVVLPPAEAAQPIHQSP